MRKPLVTSESPFWIKVLGVPFLIVVVPIFVLVKLAVLPFERPMQRSAEDVARYLRDFLDSTGGDWDWDDFVSIEIADARLEDIRARAANLELPMADTDTAPLRALIAEAETIAVTDNARNSRPSAAN